jgi:hypothetical protein
MKILSFRLEVTLINVIVREEEVGYEVRVNLVHLFVSQVTHEVG